MSENIHPSAIIDPSSQIGENVKIGPYVVIGPNVKIALEVEILAQAYLENCEIGSKTIISTGVVIGTAPQDLGYGGELAKVIIGENCQIREHVTVHRAAGIGKQTQIGNNCMLMVGSHVAHNCKLGV